MLAVPADLSISSRWILPMTTRDEVLQDHTLIVRDGRILDILPSSAAAERYAATVHADRPEHLLLPGLVNSSTQITPPIGWPAEPGQPHDGQLHDGALLCIAEMLKAGTTCFCGTGYFPEESARMAMEQGLRALIGIPIAESSSTWASNPSEYLTRALNFRDEYRGHPTIATAFAPQAPTAISDSTFSRIATLADELDTCIFIPLHESRREIDESLARHGLRPIERMHTLGLLTPALTAAHMIQVNSADIALAQRSGIALIFCPESNLRSGVGPPPVAAWAATGLRLSLGSGVDPSATGTDLWGELRLLALLSRAPDSRGVALSAWDALLAATRGGAAALGLDTEIGTLETGKWADLCCVDLRGPAMWRASLQRVSPPPVCDPLTQLVFNGTRDIVSDVWVSGRHLLNGGAFTRLDWPELATRVRAWPTRAITGE
jgi:5-methylthioadenosine/S-adenosylhomocysteine deaminase